MVEVLQELKITEVACIKTTEWVWTVAVTLAVNNKVVEVEITRFTLEILMLVSQTLCYFMNSKCITHLYMRQKLFAIQYQERVKAMDLLNLEVKKKANAPSKKCLANLLAVDKSKWIMQAKGIEIKLINLNNKINIHLKLHMVKILWIIICHHLQAMVLLEDMVHQWVGHLIRMEDGREIIQEWVGYRIQENKCLLMD